MSDSSRTRAEAVAAKLRRMIADGTYPPGARLMEVPIADRFAVSRTPVRLALGALAQEGLLVYLPQRGFLVRGYAKAEIVDSLSVRGALEGLLCRELAAVGLSPATRAQFDELIARGAQVLGNWSDKRRDAVAWSAVDGAFHAALIDAAPNGTARPLLRQLFTVPYVSPAEDTAPPVPPKGLRDIVAGAQAAHERIVAALRTGDTDAAEHEMVLHVDDTRARRAALLTEVGGTVPPPGALQRTRRRVPA